MTPVGACDQTPLDFLLSQDFKERPRRWAPGSTLLFFALIPAPSVAGDILRRARDLRARLHLHGSQRPRELLHASLTGVGAYTEVPGEVLEAASAAAETVEVPQFRVSLDHFISFNGRERYPLVFEFGAGCAAILTLRAKLQQALEQVGLTPPGRYESTPHVTTHYLRERVPRIDCEPPISWTVRDFALIKSFQGQGRHEILERWPLLQLS